MNENSYMQGLKCLRLLSALIDETKDEDLHSSEVSSSEKISSLGPREPWGPEEEIKRESCKMFKE